MLRTTKTKKEVELLIVDAVRQYETAGSRDQRPRILALMEVIDIPLGWLDDVLKGGIDCDKCEHTFLACLAQVGLNETVLCEECKIEEDPLTAMHETLQHNWREADYGEAMDHRTDHDGVTEAFPIIVRLDD